MDHFKGWLIVRFVFFTGGLLTAGVCSVCAGEPPSLLERLRQEGVAGWNELQRLGSQTEYELTGRLVRKRTGQPTQVLEGRYTHSYGAGSWLVRDINQSDESNQIRGGNPRYLFTVQRQKPDNPWFTARVDEAPPEQRDFAIDLRAPWSVSDVPLPDVVRDPTFRVTRVEESADGTLTINFKVDGSREGVPQLKGLIGGRFTCDPRRNWAVQSYDVERYRNQATKSTSHIFASATYGSPSPDYLNLTHIIYRTDWVVDGIEFDNTWENDIQATKCELSPAAFTLSAFDLPEPVLKAERKRIWLG